MNDKQTDLNISDSNKKSSIFYLKQTLITDFYKKIVFGYNKKTNSWHCLNCGIDMGPNNPRQLCGKTYCPLF